ncbi:pyrroline-5-carboxylate reductase [Rhodococcus sp. 15-725-2-2b]|jgi:pyrroline-5-carboxylate reductase|uniref:pyrroline-5-carboxylate reductase n=1 Tax=Nocardiaceae TaxID=85025 RepID=UPI00050CCDF2|nr:MULTISPECIES: pyrroline-5-carboxylate reductase [Rhodococcus]OZC56958.1 pyrroline-5-carboxylate reductase [Rhodococcus sp. 06-470-2]OZC68902.1 pyrroline-5-carboxylate reductase [Rhodococcus sp. 06-469-3-2]OZC73525.1 pyrroline-5-carboxylate reductase [Rhodococcus sp. 06-418-5]OZD45934.1 pyrroline-5-carboxylate reductase [Rhodococcus sp. 06-1477-1A]OZD84201.1 pyrroline-5-carboxylate reductase [Rhodococcus sp. 05-339-2]
MTRIAVIGGGRIGEALIAGLLESGHAVRDLVVAEKSEARAKEIAEEFGVLTTTVGDASEGADVIVLAVKPADVEAALNEITKIELDGDREQLIVSLAAGVPTAKFEPKLPAGFPVVRVMPNTPMLVGEGVSVLAPGKYARAEHLELVRSILSAVGKVVVVKENQLDAVTAVSGSGPAYFFLVAEAMIDAGVGLGLSRDVASALVVQTMVGSGAMLDRSDESASELRYAVTSPGGTTAAAVRELERNGLRAAFFDALGAANARSVEMGITAE